MDAGELTTLLTPEALRLLRDLPPYENETDVLALVSRLRKEGHEPGLVATVLTQARLRKKASSKFGPFAESMLFTPAGLEQATRLEVAAQHAGRFARAECRRVADLGCGLGADSLALASLGISVLAVERDEITAALAAYNLSSFPDVSVTHGDVSAADLAGVDGIFLDPARRTAGHNNTKRRMNPDDWSPSLTFALDAVRSVAAGGIKLGPGTDRELIPDDAEAQWIAVGDDVVEMGLWFGRARRAGVARSALILAPTGHHELTASEDAPDAPVGDLARFVYEPNGAVIRAHLIGEVARSLGGHMIDESIAYISTDTAAPTPFARGFEILETTTVDAKTISAALATHDIGRVEIKKRGIDIDPAAFRKKLTLTGSANGVVILTRSGSRRSALIARRIDERAEV
jgi:SAM-dependent methyltransferase